MAETFSFWWGTNIWERSRDVQALYELCLIHKFNQEMGWVLFLLTLKSSTTPRVKGMQSLTHKWPWKGLMKNREEIWNVWFSPRFEHLFADNWSKIPFCFAQRKPCACWDKGRPAPPGQCISTSLFGKRSLACLLLQRWALIAQNTGCFLSASPGCCLDPPVCPWVLPKKQWVTWKKKKPEYISVHQH